jgi:hypothetical protein
MWRVDHAAAIVVIVAIVCGCSSHTKKTAQAAPPALQPCGTFTFSGRVNDLNTGIINTVSFSFDPSKCSAAPCTCESICYIQMIRVFNMNSGAFLNVSGNQEQRMVTGQSDEDFNGWAVDRLDGKKWGHYGREDDGSFVPSKIITGSNSTPAELMDTPGNWPAGTWFEAITVPVCIDPASGCVNRLLGYEYWLFSTNANGTCSDPYHENGDMSAPAAFDLAVHEWNSDATGLSKNVLPPMSRMP